MRIAYITNVRFPSERAHGHQVASVASALAKLGHAIEIFAPFRRNPIKESAHAYHRLPDSVRVTYLTSFDPIASVFLPGIFGLWVQNVLLHRAILSRGMRDFDLLYTRSPALLHTLLATERPTIMELHAIPRHNRSAFVADCNRSALVVCLTSMMAKELVALGVSTDKVIVEGDAIDDAFVERFPSRVSARSTFHFPDDTFVVGYAGSLSTMGLDKGVGDLLDALTLLHRKAIPAHGLIAGGPEHAANVLRLEAKKSSADILGVVSKTDVLHVLSASDCLVYTAPHTGHPYFMRDTSPLKLFEYMASGRPIVCADTPPVHDILDDQTAVFYVPGDVQSLADALQYIIDHPDRAKAMVERAKERVRHRTWTRRMQRILSSLP